MPREKLLYNNLPNKPGIYMFKDVAGHVLYVGKAKDLKKRVSSYFAHKQTDRPWIDVMVPTVEQVETIIVNTELEALMLEATLIKKHLPKFNILLTDDKSYPYIKFIVDEPIPRFAITRKRINDKAKYFGPYLSARSAERSLEFLRSLYGIHFGPRPFGTNSDRPCLNCQLNGFTCPLNGEVDEETNLNRANSALDFLQGKRKDLVKQLDNRMIEASDREQFELAGKFRDRLQSIQRIFEKQQVISVVDDDYDAICSVISSEMACTALLRVREGRIVSQETFFFTVATGVKTTEVTRQFLLGYYATVADAPTLVVVNQDIEDKKLVESFLSESFGKKIELRMAERGDKKQTADLATKNAQDKLEIKLLTKDNSYIGLVALKEALNLPALPHRIEAVDISNLGSSEPVGAVVCFINGLPDKNEYRRYKIKTVEGQNDFAMIREVVSRRFNDTSRPTPDLFVVDGGPEQLKFAQEAIDVAPTTPVTLISLAKKPDRVFRPEKKRHELISRGNKGLLLLSRIRDEVHRFGITYHRKRQSKKSLSS